MAQVYISARDGELADVLRGDARGPCVAAPVFVSLEIDMDAQALRHELIIPELPRFVQFEAFAPAVLAALRTDDRATVTLDDLAIEWTPSRGLELDPARTDEFNLFRQWKRVHQARQTLEMKADEFRA